MRLLSEPAETFELSDIVDSVAHSILLRIQELTRNTLQLTLPEIRKRHGPYKMGIIGSGGSYHSSAWEMMKQLAEIQSNPEVVYVLNKPRQDHCGTDRHIEDCSACRFKAEVERIIPSRPSPEKPESWKPPVVSVGDVQTEEEGLRWMLDPGHQPDVIFYATEHDSEWKKQNPDSLELAEGNVPDVIRYGHLIRKLREEGREIKTTFVIYTNPTDVCALAFLKASGLPTNQVCGYNNGDAYRYRKAIQDVAQKRLSLSLPLGAIEGFTTGHHGDVIKILETARIKGVALVDEEFWRDIPDAITKKSAINAISELVISPQKQYNLESLVHQTTSFEHGPYLAWLIDGMVHGHNLPHFPVLSVYYPEPSDAADGMNHGVCASAAVDLKTGRLIELGMFYHGAPDARERLKTFVREVEKKTGEQILGLVPEQIFPFERQTEIPYSSLRKERTFPELFPSPTIEPAPRPEPRTITDTLVAVACGRQREALIYRNGGGVSPTVVKLPHSPYASHPFTISDATHIGIGTRRGVFLLPLDLFINSQDTIDVRLDNLDQLGGLLLKLPDNEKAPVRSLAQTREWIYASNSFQQTNRRLIGTGLYRWKIPTQRSGTIDDCVRVVREAVKTIFAFNDVVYYSVDDTLYLLRDNKERGEPVGQLGQGSPITALLGTETVLAAGNANGHLTLLDREYKCLVDNKQLATYIPLTSLEFVKYRGESYVIAGSEDAYVVVLRLSDQKIVASRKLGLLETEKPVRSIKAFVSDDPELVISYGNTLCGCSFSTLLSPANDRVGFKQYRGVQTDRKVHAISLIPR